MEDKGYDGPLTKGQGKKVSVPHLTSGQFGGDVIGVDVVHGAVSGEFDSRLIPRQHVFVAVVRGVHGKGGDAIGQAGSVTRRHRRLHDLLVESGPRAGFIGDHQLFLRLAD